MATKLQTLDTLIVNTINSAASPSLTTYTSIVDSGTTGALKLQTQSASTIDLYINSTLRWNIGQDILPATAGTNQLGSAALPIAALNVGNVGATIINQISYSNGESAGTVGTTSNHGLNIRANNATKLKLLTNGNLQFTNTAFELTSNTTDASDSSEILINGGGGSGATRGGQIALYGNENGNLGGVTINTGVVAGGNLSLIVNNSTGVIKHRFNGADRWTWNDGGEMFFGATIAIIRADTTDGTDTKRLIITAGGSNDAPNRGAYLSLDGADHASTGVAVLSSSDTSNSYVTISAAASNGIIRFFTAGTEKWRFQSTGNLVPLSDNTVNIGSTGAQPSRIFVVGLRPNFIQFNNNTNGDIYQSTTDGADTSRTRIGGGGDVASTRGAFIELLGNESTQFAAGGELRIVAGNIATGHISLETLGTSRWKIQASTGYLLGTSGVERLIGTDTSSGSDNGRLILTGSGGIDGLRGATISMYGNNYSAGSEGLLNFAAGSNATNSHIVFNTLGSERWRITATGGHLVGTSVSNAKQIRLSDQASELYLCGGDGNNASANGAIIQLNGYTHATAAGAITLAGSNLATGLVKIASNHASADIELSANNPTGTRKLILSGTDGSLTTTTPTAVDFVLKHSTTDGADNKAINIAGGGLADVSRGAYIQIAGNEHTATGTIQLRLGNSSSARLQMYLQSGTAVQVINSAAADIFRIEEYGRVSHKAHANYSGSGHFKYTKAVNTTDATTTTLFQLGDISAGVADNTTYTFTVDIVGRYNSTTAKGIGGKLKFVVYRNNGGSATIAADFGGRIREKETYGSSGYDFDVDVSGNDVRIRVTGAASETVSWVMNAEWIAVSTSA